MERAWTIRTYKEGDEDEIFELVKVVYPGNKYNREKWMSWWRWMYTENPAGVSRVLVADHGGKIVGHYPLIPVKMKVAGEIMNISQNVDVMTHPDYRHQGIFFTLEKKALSEAEKEGIDITYGFPNEAAYPGHLKSGWFDICKRQILIKPLNLENTLKIRIKNKFLIKICATIGKLIVNLFCQAKNSPEINGLKISKITSFDDGIDDFWNTISNDYEIITVRNKEYLNWRYVDVPDVDYTIYLAEKGEEIYGYIVLRCVEQGETTFGYIFDLVACLNCDGVIHSLISKAIEYFENEKVDLIVALMIQNKELNKILRKNGFIISRFIKNGHFCAYRSHPKMSKIYLKNEKNWFIHVGDSDLI